MLLARTASCQVHGGPKSFYRRPAAQPGRTQQHNECSDTEGADLQVEPADARPDLASQSSAPSVVGERDAFLAQGPGTSRQTRRSLSDSHAATGDPVLNEGGLPRPQVSCDLCCLVFWLPVQTHFEAADDLVDSASNPSLWHLMRLGSNATGAAAVHVVLLHCRTMTWSGIRSLPDGVTEWIHAAAESADCAAITQETAEGERSAAAAAAPDAAQQPHHLAPQLREGSSQQPAAVLAATEQPQSSPRPQTHSLPMQAPGCSPPQAASRQLQTSVPAQTQSMQMQALGCSAPRASSGQPQSSLPAPSQSPWPQASSCSAPQAAPRQLQGSPPAAKPHSLSVQAPPAACAQPQRSPAAPAHFPHAQDGRCTAPLAASEQPQSSLPAQTHSQHMLNAGCSAPGQEHPTDRLQPAAGAGQAPLSLLGLQEYDSLVQNLSRAAVQATFDQVRPTNAWACRQLLCRATRACILGAHTHLSRCWRRMAELPAVSRQQPAMQPCCTLQDCTRCLRRPARRRKQLSAAAAQVLAERGGHALASTAAPAQQMQQGQAAAQDAPAAAASWDMQLPGQLSPFSAAFFSQLLAVSTTCGQPGQLAPLSAAQPQPQAPRSQGPWPAGGAHAVNAGWPGHQPPDSLARAAAGSPASPGSMGHIFAASQQLAAQGKGLSGVGLSPLDGRAPGSPPPATSSAAAVQLPAGVPTGMPGSSVPDSAGGPPVTQLPERQAEATRAQSRVGLPIPGAHPGLLTSSVFVQVPPPPPPPEQCLRVLRPPTVAPALHGAGGMYRAGALPPSSSVHLQPTQDGPALSGAVRSPDLLNCCCRLR